MVELVKNIILSDISNEEKLERLYDYHYNDLATCLEQFDLQTRMVFYEVVPVEMLSEIIAYTENPEQYLEEVGLSKAADIVENMDTDDAIEVLEELEEEDKEKILDLVDSEALKDIELVDSYEEDYIGSLISTNYIVVDYSDDVATVMNKLVKDAAENDNIDLIFVLKDEKYFGLIFLRDLFIARKTTPLKNIIYENYPKFYDYERVDQVYPTLSNYDLPLYPVIDKDEHLLGVFTSNDVIEIINEEFEEDINRFAALPEAQPDEKLLSRSIRRLPWLITLLVLGVFISLVISRFEHVVVALPIVIFFQSLVLNMSGNVGTQSLAVTIRALNDEHLSKTDTLKVVLKEVLIGFLNGLILAVISTVLIGLFIFITKLAITEDGRNDLVLSFITSGVIGIALVISMTISSLFGTLIPILFKKIKIDPSIASGPFITTINDIVAVLSYYGLAYLLIIGLVL